MISVCVDAMGGDEGPEVVLRGIELALADDPELEVLVVGNDEYVSPFAERTERVRALVSTEVIGMGEHPAQAVRMKRDSSIVRACRAVKTGEAQGFFSAGATGAIHAAATLYTGRLKGIKRPAIAATMPSPGGKEKVFLDMGANADVRPDMMVQFAYMGVAYATGVLGISNPRVALLSNGTEDAKGNEATIAAHEALAAEENLNFIGNCEGYDILMGDIDVIVTDGFSGNIALKTLEGTAKFILAEIKAATKESKVALLGGALIKPSLSGLKAQLSGDGRGGAILLGLRAPVLIGHGATSEEAVRNGIRATADAIRGDIVGKIAQESPSIP